MMLKEEQKVMPLEKLEKYIIEWIYGARISFIPADEKSDDLIYQISDINNDIVYRSSISAKDAKNRERAMISTDGIFNDELKGCVEQCIALDIQIEEYKNAAEKQSSDNLFAVINAKRASSEDVNMPTIHN